MGHPVFWGHKKWLLFSSTQNWTSDTGNRFLQRILNYQGYQVNFVIKVWKINRAEIYNTKNTLIIVFKQSNFIELFTANINLTCLIFEK